MSTNLSSCRYLLFLVLPFVLSLLVINRGCAAGNITTLKRQAKHFYWGVGVEQNYAKALELYLKASDLGDTGSKFIAGGMYYNGMGVEILLKQLIFSIGLQSKERALLSQSAS
jgi:TPR repeat protein